MDGRAWIKNRMLKPLYLNLVVFSMPQNPIYHIFNLNTGLEHAQRPAQCHVSDVCISFNTIFIQNFPHVSSKPFNQPPSQSEAKCFLREKWSSGERLPSHFITASQWACSKHNRKQQNYYFPSDGNRSLFKNNVNYNVNAQVSGICPTQ